MVMLLIGIFISPVPICFYTSLDTELSRIRGLNVHFFSSLEIGVKSFNFMFFTRDFFIRVAYMC